MSENATGGNQLRIVGMIAGTGSGESKLSSVAHVYFRSLLPSYD